MVNVVYVMDIANTVDVANVIHVVGVADIIENAAIIHMIPARTPNNSIF